MMGSHGMRQRTEEIRAVTDVLAGRLTAVCPLNSDELARLGRDVHGDLRERGWQLAPLLPAADRRRGPGCSCPRLRAAPIARLSTDPDCPTHGGAR